MDGNWLDSAVAFALAHVARTRDVFGELFPTYGYPEYALRPNDHWVAGFWPGILWLAYHATGEAVLREKAESLLPSFTDRLANRVHLDHDLGFLYTLSARAPWQLMGDTAAREMALAAADLLRQRVNPRGGYIQAWGGVGEPGQAGRMIVDCMMNLPLLFWAAAQTGDAQYRDAARQHAITTRQHLVRPDGSTYHTYLFDPETGVPLGPQTYQGYADDSLWSRGQAWAIYGFALAAQWLDDPEFLNTAEQAADRFLRASPPDRTPLWDFWLMPGAPQYQDSSAGTIAVCGLLRLAGLTGKSSYRSQAEALLNVLVWDCMEMQPGKQGLLRHGAQHVPGGVVPDGYLIHGDYFFLEALLTLAGRGMDFWGPVSK